MSCWCKSTATFAKSFFFLLLAESLSSWMDYSSPTTWQWPTLTATSSGNSLRVHIDWATTFSANPADRLGNEMNCRWVTWPNLELFRSGTFIQAFFLLLPGPFNFFVSLQDWNYVRQKVCLRLSQNHNRFWLFWLTIVGSWGKIEPQQQNETFSIN